MPGLTDGKDGQSEHPERLLAQVVFSADGGAEQQAWLTHVGRVGNNYRFRWELPRETLVHTAWQRYDHAFRFSTDGQSWYRIGQAEGPEGGAPRTLERDPTF